jgi:hypothetical protein
MNYLCWGISFGMVQMRQELVPELLEIKTHELYYIWIFVDISSMHSNSCLLLKNLLSGILTIAHVLNHQLHVERIYHYVLRGYEKACYCCQLQILSCLIRMALVVIQVH